MKIQHAITKKVEEGSLRYFFRLLPKKSKHTVPIRMTTFRMYLLVHDTGSTKGTIYTQDVTADHNRPQFFHIDLPRAEFAAEIGWAELLPNESGQLAPTSDPIQVSIATSIEDLTEYLQHVN